MRRDEQIVKWLAANVRRVRRRRIMTQEQLASALDMDDPRYVQRIEAGTINVTVVMLAKLARILGVRPSELIRKASMVKRLGGRPPKDKEKKAGEVTARPKARGRASSRRRSG